MSLITLLRVCGKRIVANMEYVQYIGDDDGNAVLVMADGNHFKLEASQTEVMELING